MAFLLLDLLMLALLAAAMWLAYAQRLQLRGADEPVTVPGVDYAALHAQWERERRVRDREAVLGHARRWDELGGGAAAPLDGGRPPSGPARAD